nr:response regulator transcription factor [Gammaproteobacteria bacterium]
MLTGCNDSETHRMCLRMSAVGVFTKDQPNALLLKAIRQVHSGELWINRHTTTALFHDFRRQTELVPP